MAEIIFNITFFVVVVGFSAYFILMLHFSRKTNGLRKERIHPFISLVIPAYNEEEVILKRLKNVAHVEYPKEKIEILVVNDGSSDGTAQIVRNFIELNQNGFKIRLLDIEKRGGKSRALNHAFRLCHGDIVIISDADVFFAQDALARMVANFSDPRVGAVSGMEVIANPEYSSATRTEQGYRSFYNTLRLGESNLDSVLMCESGFAAYRHELLEDLPEECICDDMELTLKTREKGFKAIYDPDVHFYEYVPITYKSKFKQKIRRAQGNQQTLFRFAPLMFKRKYGTFASVVLPFEFFMHIIAPILIPVCIISYVVSLKMAPSIFGFILPILVLLGDFLIIAVALRFLSPATSITLKESTTNKKGFNLFTLIIDFLSLQACLLVGLFSLIFRKRRHKWEQIEETRKISDVSNDY